MVGGALAAAAGRPRPAVARPSVTTTSSGRRRGSRIPSTRSVSAAQSSPSASGVRPPLGSSANRRAATSTEEVGGRARVAPGAPERDQPDLVPALVGVQQQRQHGRLHRLHPPPGRHRAGRVDAEQDQVRLSALDHRPPQIVAGESQRPRRLDPAAAADPPPRGWSPAGAAGRPARRRSRATVRPTEVMARLRRPASPLPLAAGPQHLRPGTARPPARRRRS